MKAKEFKAILWNDFVCYGNSLSEIKRKLSKEANKRFDTYDYARVYTYRSDYKIYFELNRINKKYPNNTIKRGKWL